MKVLNLYAGIGGNRKLWTDVEVTSVEYNEEIAMIYKDNFPDDKLIIGDAHDYLLQHYKEFDFIWASPPCPTHSRIRKLLATKRDKDGNEWVQNEPCFPDMKLYQEIIFLDNYFDGLYIVENVEPYYEPLITPQKLGRHFIWANFKIGNIEYEYNGHWETVKEMETLKGFDLSKYKIKTDKKTILRNCVHSEIGRYVLDCARGIVRQKNVSQTFLNFEKI